MGLLQAGRDVRTISALLLGAEREAHAGGDDLPGAEHLLLSTFELPDGTATRAFGRFGVDAVAFRAALEQVHADALSSIGAQPPGPADVGAGPDRQASGPFRSTPQAQQVFQEAVRLSKQAVPSRLLGAHVVAAACALEHGTTARVLAAMVLDRDELRSAALDEARATGS